MITARTYNTVTGSNILVHHTLFGVDVICVSREGVIHKQVTPFIANQPEFFHIAGRVVFDTQFPFLQNERVRILYKS